LVQPNRSLHEYLLFLFASNRRSHPKELFLLHSEL
jgi:hypothetical protein